MNRLDWQHKLYKNENMLSICFRIKSHLCGSDYFKDLNINKIKETKLMLQDRLDQWSDSSIMCENFDNAVKTLIQETINYIDYKVE